MQYSQSNGNERGIMTFETWKDRRSNARCYFIGQTAGILLLAPTSDKDTLVRYLREATDELNAEIATIDAEYNAMVVANG